MTLLAALGALFGAALVSAPVASANTLDSFTLSASTARAGDTITATATWTATDAITRQVLVTLPGTLGATWASASTTPTRTCVIATPPTEAACLWNSHVSGDTITMTATFVVPAAATPATYDIVASANAADTNGPITQQLTILSEGTPAVSVSPSTVQAGATATATGTFTALTTGDITVGVYLLGTSGNGTFGSPVSVPNLSGCTLDSSLRAYSCTWTGATVGDTRTIAIPVVVAASTPSGSTFTVQACTNRNTATSHCISTDLTITTVAPPTPTTTPTTSPSVTASASTTAAPTSTPSQAELPTAVPAGSGPLDPPEGRRSGLPWLVGAVLALAGIGALLTALPRGKHQG